MNVTKGIFFFLFPVLLVTFLLHYKIVGQAVYGDGIYYYAYTRSLYKDHDISFSNELGHHYSPQNNNAVVEEKPGKVEDYTEKGYASNRYPIAASLAWLPSYTIADGLAHILHLLNKNISLTGYSDIYQITIGITNILFIIFGLYFLSQILLRYFSSSIVFTTLTTITLGSNLFYYGGIDVVNSIPFVFFLSCIFATVFLRTLKKPTLSLYFIFGTLCGLLALTRTQELISLCLPFSLLAYQYVLQKEIQANQRVKTLLLSCFFVGLGFILIFQLQMVVWYIMYGTILHSPYIVGKDTFYFFEPHLLELLFDAKIGLFWWSPLYILGPAGLFIFRKQEKHIAWFCLLFVACEYYVIASWSAWAQGESYSVRMLISSLPFLSFGFAAIFEYIQKRWNRWFLYALCLGFIMFTFIRIIYFLEFSQSATYDLGVNTNKENATRLMRLVAPFNSKR